MFVLYWRWYVYRASHNSQLSVLIVNRKREKRQKTVVNLLFILFFFFFFFREYLEVLREKKKERKKKKEDQEESQSIRKQMLSSGILTVFILFFVYKETYSVVCYQCDNSETTNGNCNSSTNCTGKACVICKLLSIYFLFIALIFCFLQMWW